MRRALGACVVLALIAVSPVALAASEWENYKDTFDSGGYNGNDGSLKWSGPWKEVGESDGPTSGKVRVEGSGCSGKCLVIDTGLLGLGAGAYRLADTGDFSDAKLSYTVAFDGALLGLLNASLTVEATSNGGASWSTVQSIPLGSEGGAKSVDVSGFRDEHFGIRFRVTGAAGAEVLIDNVEVAGTVPASTTTTSTTTTSTTTTSTTSTTSTTTTSSTTTTTLLPDLTSTTLPKLITTTTTTTIPPTTTTTSSSSSDDGGTATTQTTTTTTIAAGTGGGSSDGPGAGDDEGTGNGSGDGSGESSGSGEIQRTSGLLQPPVGLGADIPTDLFGSTPPEVLGFDIAPGFSDAVELIEATWIWVLALALLITGALVKGIDRRVSPIPGAPNPG